MVLKCVRNLLLCPSLLYVIPTEKHELEFNLSIAWYKVQYINLHWNLTVYYSTSAQFVTEVEVS